MASYEAHRATVEDALSGLFVDAWPARFGEVLRYPLQTGGKRVRPVLCLTACEALGADPASAVPAALAVELVHTYSLVHDDLPCMDDDDERRGKPTVHRAYDEGSAVLCGDALLTEAFRVVLGGPQGGDAKVRMVQRLSDAAGYRGMVGGQAADVGLGGPVTDIDTLLALHRGKTGALLAASAVLGGMAAGATERQLDALERYGQAVGLAFQLADDVLDAEEDAGDDGPPSYVKLLGIDETQRRAARLRDDALAAAGALPQPAGLEAIARFVVDRQH